MRLHIMLGTACNWKCKYCIQLKQAGFNQKLAPDFCQNLKDFIDTNQIQIDRIEYWGGEPCLYFDQIKQIEETLEGNRKPSRFVTNGSLLTTEIIDFLNDKNFYVNLSYHEGQLTEDKWQQALLIGNLNVTSLIHAKCLDWEIYFQKWNEIRKTYGRSLNWYIYNLYNVENVNEYALTKEHIDQYIEYLYLIFPLTHKSVFYRNALYSLFDLELSKEKLYSCACFNPEILSIDTRGNQYICHHACSNQYRIGNIFDKGISPVQINTLKDKCYTCPLLKYCAGGCMREISDTSCYFLQKLAKVKEDYWNSNAI